MRTLINTPFLLGVMVAGTLCAVSPLAWATSVDVLKPYATFRATVTQVVDGDTVRLNTGHTVRLLDINTPERAHDGRAAQAFSSAATDGLRAMVLNQPVAVQLGPRVYDPYDRVLGHLFLDRATPNRWINGGLVRAGLAHVYTFPDNRLYGPDLLALEDAARAAKAGIWALPRWHIRAADKCCAADDIGRFHVVEGRVRGLAVVRDTTYLNFGPDWRSDFSVAIPRKQDKLFRKAGIKNYNAWLGRTLRVRGVTAPINGVLIRVTHPEQIHVLD